MNQLQKKLREKQIKVLCTDYYDTLVHRHVHPNQVLRIWSKIMINELGLETSIDKLYFTFKESVNYLVEKLDTDRNELPYDTLRDEIYTRLNNSNIVSDDQKAIFITLFEKAQLGAEKSVQYLNENTVKIIKDFKNGGGKVYLISDFYGPKSLFESLLKHHKIGDLFDDIYISSAFGKSKHKGTIYNDVIAELSIDPNTALMIGDNPISDSKHAEKAGLHSYVLPHKQYIRKNKVNSFGSDRKAFKKTIKRIYRDCQKKDTNPYSEYVICYHFFTERLYNYCKQHNVRSLFFLSREGLFLKRLFDSYAEFHQLNEENKIRTHYLKVSRQASLQISLKSIEEEEFRYLRRKYKDMSINEFLSFFNFNELQKEEILKSLDADGNHLVENFLDSSTLKELRKDAVFINYYEAHRVSNKTVFTEYLDSFNEDIFKDGIHVVDIGWGGTMQEAMYNFFRKEIKVTGFYLGVNLIYNPNSDTKRHGLNFSMLPYEDYNCHMLRANTQLYEQFAGAGHGCTIAYSKSDDGYTIEYHEQNEKWLYDNYIEDHQNTMFAVHKRLLNELQSICYTDAMIGDILLYVALKTGTLQNTRKIKFLETLTSGYYQNISNKKTGIEYDIPKNLISLKSLIKFIIKPEEFFRFVVKLKQKLYKSNKIISYFYPGFLIYVFYKFNHYLRFKLLKNVSLLKFNYFK